jgi:hypothetical protein
MFLAMRETRFAKRVVRQLLKSHSAIIAENPSLSGEPLYREILLHTKLVDPSRVDEILCQAIEGFLNLCLIDSYAWRDPTDLSSNNSGNGLAAIQ